MSAEWYCKVMGEESGPFSSEQLREMAASRNLLPDSLVKKGKDGEWALSAKVKGLFEAATGKNELGTTSIPAIQEPPKPATKSAHVKGREFQAIALKCPSCGAHLDITPEMESFACGYCGTQQLVLRSGGTVRLKLIGEAIAKVQLGTDRTAAELAIRRLSENLADLKARRTRFSRDTAGTINLLVGGSFALIVALFGVALSLFISRDWQGGSLTGAIGAIIGFFAIRLAHNNIKARRAQIRSIDERASELGRELAKHHETVST